jgi:hypothetical protein
MPRRAALRRELGCPGRFDGWATYEWEADLASRVATSLAFWIWYLPAETIRHRRSQRNLRVVDVASAED